MLTKDLIAELFLYPPDTEIFILEKGKDVVSPHFVYGDCLVKTLANVDDDKPVLVHLCSVV